ncbi:hypothetical protein U1Q18_032697 [Sarracenia purpurea var. burkii]
MKKKAKNSITKYQTRRVLSNRSQDGETGRFVVSPNRFQTLSFETDNYEETFPPLSGSSSKTQKIVTSKDQIFIDAAEVNTCLLEMVTNFPLDLYSRKLASWVSKDFEEHVKEASSDPVSRASLKERVYWQMSEILSEAKKKTNSEGSAAQGIPPLPLIQEATQGKVVSSTVSREKMEMGKDEEEIDSGIEHDSVEVEEKEFKAEEEGTIDGKVVSIVGLFGKGNVELPFGVDEGSPKVGEGEALVDAHNVLDKMPKQDPHLGSVSGLVMEGYGADDGCEEVVYVSDEVEFKVVDVNCNGIDELKEEGNLANMDKSIGDNGGISNFACQVIDAMPEPYSPTTGGLSVCKVFFWMN